jgi:ferredoxin
MLTINEDCINCNACIDECPNNAIYPAGEEYALNGETMPPLSTDYTFIVNDLCKLCEGYSDSPSCMSVCPSDAVLQS